MPSRGILTSSRRPSGRTTGSGRTICDIRPVQQPPTDQGGRMLCRIATLLLASLGLACSAVAAEIRVLAPNAAKESVSEAISVYERATGHKVVVAWTGTEAISKRVTEGEVVDVVVNAAQNIDRLSKEGKLMGGTRTDFARSSIGVEAGTSSSFTAPDARRWHRCSSDRSCSRGGTPVRRR